MIQIYRDKEIVREECMRRRCTGERVCLVPTMGALHEGHLSLVRRALEHAEYVIVSIFVNPTQFGPGEDYERYPRTLEGDAEKLESVGAHAVFAPDEHMLYPDGYSTYVTVDGLTDGLCGASRPGHFRGVTTIVSKLFSIVRPDCAVFGQKDAQQLAVIRRMTHDLELGVDIISAPIVREPDGLAMSSRNAYLKPDERAQAVVLNRALECARENVNAGMVEALALSKAIRTIIEKAPLADIEYIAIVDEESVKPVDVVSGDVLIALAVRFGNTRLIDNCVIHG